MAGIKAIECFSTMSITEMLCINLSAYTEIKLYRACKAIHSGNQLRCNWWQNMERMIQIASSKHNLPQDKTGTPLVGVSLQERSRHWLREIRLTATALLRMDLEEEVQEFFKQTQGTTWDSMKLGGKMSTTGTLCENLTAKEWMRKRWCWLVLQTTLTKAFPLLNIWD